MLTHLIAILLRVLTTVSDADADALRSTAPGDLLTLEAARGHLADVRVAAVVAGVDADLVASIGWHESRYDYRAVTREKVGGVSCGVMTAEPLHDLAACRLATSSPLAGYVEGSLHLAGWIAASSGHLRTALLGFAGGYVGIAYCRDPQNQRDYRCATPEVFLSRARQIRRALSRASSVSAPAS